MLKIKKKLKGLLFIRTFQKENAKISSLSWGGTILRNLESTALGSGTEFGHHTTRKSKERLKKYVNSKGHAVA
jgi:hypothetical protein